MSAARLFVCLVFISAVFVPIAAAQPPETVLIQGQLLDGDGEALTGTRDYRVRFYDAATNGAQLGGDLTGQTTLSTEGLFAIPLVPPSAVLEAAAAWYELALDSSATPDGIGPADVFGQRVRVHSVPFARVAGEALQVSVSAIGDGSVNMDEFNALTNVTGNVQVQLDAKANSADVYTQTIIDNQQAAQDALIAQKANTADLFQWLVTIAGPVQMEPNRGYVVNDTAEVMFTLPTDGELAVGDTIRISGIGQGGWRIGQNNGQQILAQNILAPDFKSAWIPRDSSRDWFDIAASADGNTLVAAERNGGNLYTSSDGGTTWMPRDSVRNWRAVATNADGSQMVAVVTGGQIYISQDFGVTWTPRDFDRNWTDVASSADGTRLVATVSGGRIYTSDDSGQVWDPRDSDRNWFGCASSADGTKLVASHYGGRIYTSDDAGVTWTPRDVDRSWWQIASSADGTKLVVGVEGGQLYTSTDSGATWTPRDSSRQWVSLASSANGMRLAAAVQGGQIYISTDSGVSWSPVESNRAWWSVTSTADGSRLFAVAASDQIYLSPQGLAPVGIPATAGAAGGLTGRQHSAVELQYVGNGTFLPLSFAGVVDVL